MADQEKKINLTLIIRQKGQSDEKILSVKIHHDLTINELKTLVVSLSGLEASNQEVKYNNTKLGDWDKLDKVGVSDNDMIHIMDTRLYAAPAQVQAAPATRRRPPPPQNDGLGLGLQRPTMPPLLRLSAEQFKAAVNQNGSIQAISRQDPELGEALLLNDTTKLKTILAERKSKIEKAQREFDDMIKQYNDNPFDPAVQQKFQDAMREANVRQNFENAIEEMPEAFGKVVMLYIPVEVAGIKTIAFVDSGAQTTIMNKQLAEKCGLLRLMDTRWAQTMVGVGTAKSLGRIHLASLKFGGMHLQTSFTVMDGDNMKFLLGLDMLRRWQAVIDLKDNCLRIGDQKVKFLQEKDIPHLSEQNKSDAHATGLQFGDSAASPAPTALPAPGPPSNRPVAEQREVEMKEAPAAPLQSTADHPLPTRRSADDTPMPQQSAAAAPTPQVVPSAATPSTPVAAPAALPAVPQPNPPTGQNWPQASINSLMGLGVTRGQAIAALNATGGNAQLAASMLFS